MANTVTLTVTARVPGVVLTSGVAPSTPVLTPQAGLNKLDIQWSKASGQAAKELVEVTVVVALGTAPDVFRFVKVSWGDNMSNTQSAIGTGATKVFQHTYQSASQMTITAEALTANQSLIASTQTTLTPNLTANWDVQQIQIERYKNDMKEVRIDWRDVTRVPLSFTDHTVRRGYPYKYRYRLRSVDGTGAASAISQFSALAQANWS